jgi:hypothetical protein
MISPQHAASDVSSSQPVFAKYGQSVIQRGIALPNLDLPGIGDSREYNLGSESDMLQVAEVPAQFHPKARLCLWQHC